MMIRHRSGLVLGVAAGLLVLALAGCAAGPGLAPGADAATLPGFWLGLWHGFICPIAFLVSLFNDRVSIYEVHNGGHWYDFGYVVGLSIIFGGTHGGAAARRRTRR